VESTQAKRPAAMVVYITKKDDTLWKIAKKYKITREAITDINELEEPVSIPEGTRLLIVK
jgi:LysM repeat protein